jgi:hypothetical protein
MTDHCFDIIGDIHGYADTLIKLLEHLEYRQINGVYQHPERKVVFLGDFIDRGTQQREVLQTVIPMVNYGHALSVMGNHEFNALAFHTKEPTRPDCWLRPRTNKNIQQHIRFLEEYLSRSDELATVLEFFRSLPLWLDLEGFRVVHACWDYSQIKNLKHQNTLTPELLLKSSKLGTTEYDAIEILLKGSEYELPSEKYFVDKDGYKRTAVRTRWWINEDCLLKDAVLPSRILDDETGELPMLKGNLVGYNPSEKPVFVGHYWFKGTPKRLTPNVACLDYSIAKGGKLAAYRWDGESELSDDKFIYVS